MELSPVTTLSNGPVSKAKNLADVAQEVLFEFRQVSGDRGNWEAHWTEIAERIWPNHSFLFMGFGIQKTEGEKRTFRLFDSTAALALNRFGAILDSLLTPRNQKWHRLKPADKMLEKNHEVMMWFEVVNDLLFKYRYAPQANFSSQNQLVYKSLGAYGTGAMFIDSLANEPGLRYKNTFLGEMYFFENHQGIVDRAIRHFMMRARPAAQLWGDTLPDEIKQAAINFPNRPYYFLHCVKPRGEPAIFRKDYKGMPYASYYVSVTGAAGLSEGGYRTFPYAVPRYEQMPHEVYGRSPAMDVLPAIKTLNEQKKAMLKQAHRVIDPILLVHDDGIIDTFSLKPGAMNAGGISADGRPLVQPLPTGNVQLGKEMMDEERNLINDAFLVSLFQILVQTPEMTATEALERAREKGILLNPTLGRQQSEYLGPMIDREIDVLMSQNLLPPMPKILKQAQGEYIAEYDSPLSRAQRAEEASGLMRTIESALQIVQVTQNPEPLDFFNWDVVIPEVASINGTPLAWMRTLDQVKIIRNQRSQDAQINQAITAAPGAAAMIKAGAAAQKAGGGNG